MSPDAEHSAHDETPDGLSTIVTLSPEALKQGSIQSTLPVLRSVDGHLRLPAVIQADANRVFHVNSFVSGRISRDHVNLGDTVRAGQVLASVHNLEVAKIQADYIHQLHGNEIEIELAQTRWELAQKNLERERQLLDEGISPRKDYQQAEAEAIMAQQALAGKHEHAVHIQSEAKALLSAYGNRPVRSHAERINPNSPITAPRAGIVIKKHITTGDMVTPDTVLYEVADLSKVWLELTVYPDQLSQVRPGQTVRFQTDSLPNRTMEGVIDYLSPVINPETQTYSARVALDNTQRQLRPGLLGYATVSMPEGLQRPFVPRDAVQRYGREYFVFVPLENNRFEKRTVRLAGASDTGYWIQEGLQNGESVVSQGAFVLKAELLKDQYAGDGH